MRQRGMGLTSAGLRPVDIDSLTYAYDYNSNQLISVSDSVKIDYSLHDFQDRSSLTQEYYYDDNGNLSRDANKYINSIAYNELDLPVWVYSAGGASGNVQNVYDAAGTLLEKRITYPANPSQPTCVYKYVGPFVYRNDSLLYFNHEEGRARYLYDSSKFKYDFFVKDHLGNVRMTIASDVSGQYTDYLATHEVAAAKRENLVFENIDVVREDRNWAPGPDNVKCARLNGAIDSLRIGTSLLLNVMAGDNFELAAHAYYDASVHAMPDPQYADRAGMLQSLLSTLSGQGFGPGGGGDGGGGGGGMDYGALHTLLNWENFNQFTDIQTAMTDSAAPQAYLNYMMFDEDMQLVPAQSGAVQINSTCADNWSVIQTQSPITIKRNGSLLVYISAVRGKDVYFDDVHVVHKKGRLLEENHYYPHGLTIRSGSANPVPTRQGYQSKELQDEAGLELYDFHARQYDPQIGRFWGIDPADQFPSGYTGMGNDPANNIDPDGMQSYGAGGSQTGRSTLEDRRMTNKELWSYTMGSRSNILDDERFGGLGIAGVGNGRGSAGAGQGNEKAGFYSSYPTDWITTYYTGSAEEGTFSYHNRLNRGFLLSQGDNDHDFLPSIAGSNWYGAGGQYNYFFGAAATVLETSSSTYRLYSSGYGFSPWIYSKGYPASTHFTRRSVGRVGGLLGKLSLAIGVILDAKAVMEWQKDPTSTNAVHPGKAGLNTGVALHGAYINPYFALIYFGVDSFYPGGWTEAASQLSNMQTENTRILGPQFQLTPRNGW